MEETLESYPVYKEMNNSILAYGQNNGQAGSSLVYDPEELFGTALQYAIFHDNFRPYHIDDDNHMDQSPINLGPTAVNIHKESGESQYDQRQLLLNDNLLRPKGGDNKPCTRATRSNEFGLMPENGSGDKSAQFPVYVKRGIDALAKIGHTDPAQEARISHPWIQERATNFYGPVPSTDNNLVDVVAQDGILSKS